MKIPELRLRRIGTKRERKSRKMKDESKNSFPTLR